MTAAAVPAVSAHTLKQAIASRYEPPEWHCESEVTLGGRRLDVVALNLWGSRSYRIVGFELKVSRGDWLRELDQFHKSEQWRAVVDAFYVVTPPKLVKDDELPVGWGLLELSGSRMMTRRHADTREGTATLPREVAARFIGRLAEKDRRAELAADMSAREALRAQIRAEVEGRAANEMDAVKVERDQLAKNHAELLAALNLKPHDWQAHGRAMKAAAVFSSLGDTANSVRARLETTARDLEAHADRLRSALASLSEPAP